jgi:hypothetical protein
VTFLYPQKKKKTVCIHFADKWRSLGIVRSRAQALEFFFYDAAFNANDTFDPLDVIGKIF